MSATTLRITLLLCAVAGFLLSQQYGQTGAAIGGKTPTFGATETKASPNALLASVTRMPLFFEPVQERADTPTKFLGRGRGYRVLLSSHEAFISFRPQATGLSPNPGKGNALREKQSGLRIWFPGANRSVRFEAHDELPGKSNYIIGSDPSRWRKNVPHFARVAYKQISPGIDLTFYGGQEALEFDVVVSPEADFTRFILAVVGARKLRIDASGDLRIRAGGENFVLRKPLIYQPVGNRRLYVEGGYKILGRGRVGFWVAHFDRSLPLIIDPSLVYSTFLGGSDDDSAAGVAVDSSGKVYIAGSTKSLDFPTQPAQQKPGGSGNYDLFVTKIDPSQSGAASLVYSTYIGGSKDDKALGIAVDASGNAAIVGVTNSPDFPTLNPFKGGFSGPSDTSDITVTRLDATGSNMIFSTYFGGSSTEGTGVGGSIAVDSVGNIYITSDTESSDLFTTVGALQPSLNGTSDAFVTKFSAAGAVLYSTYLGGSGTESGTGIAADASGIYVAGVTSSNDFTTKNGFQPSFGGATDAFVVKLNPQGQGQNDLLYSTYLGGAGEDEARAIAIDSSGNVYVTGDTFSNPSNPFPTTAGAFQSALAGGQDAFVAQLNPSATGAASLLYSTYLGGTSDDSGRGIAVNSSFGKIYVTGGTSSTDFPSVSAIQGSLGGAQDAFVAKFDPSSSGKASLVYSTFLGGAANDAGNAIAADGSGNAYVAGQTLSSDFPVTTSSAYQNACKSCGGATPLADAFFAKISDAGAAPAANFNPPSFNIGNVPVGMTGVPGTIAFSNTGNAILQITSIAITGSTDFSQTNNCPSSLAGGAAPCSIVVTFKPTAAATETASISVSDNAPGSPQNVPLSGTGIAPAAALSAMSLNFGSQPLGTTSNAATVTLANSGNAPLTISSVNISGTNSSDFAPTEDSCPIAPGTLAAGSSCVVGITFSPTASGSRTAQLIFTDDSNSASGSTQTVQLMGTGIPPAAIAGLLPASEDFGSINVGATSAPATFSLTNRGNLTLHVASIQLTGSSDFAFVAPSSPACTLGGSSQLLPNTSCNLAVTFKPSAAGGEAAQIIVTDDSGNVSGTTQTASLTGSGAAPIASVSPTSLTTAGQLVGTASAPAPIMLKNIGTGLLNYQVSFGGADSGDFTESDTCGGTVNQGTTCNLMVVFAPKMTGARAATMIITDNSNGMPNSQSVPLAGTGTDFSFQPASGGSTSVTVSAGQNATYNLDLIPVDGFAGAVTLTCTGAPSEAVCSPSPASLNVSNSSLVPFTVIVTTTAPSLLPPNSLREPGLFILVLLSLAGLIGLLRRRPRIGRIRLATVPSFIVLAALLLFAGCNVASSTVGNPGTPSGTYPLTLSGTQQGASRTINLTLIVR